MFAAFGTYKMLKAKRVRFFIYAIANSLWVAFGLFLGSNDTMTLVYVVSSIAFVVFFALNRKALN